jgi:hypothetical protein
MRRIEAFSAFLAVFFLARATAADAGEDTASASPPYSTGADNFTPQADLQNVPVKLSQIVTPGDKDFLVGNDPAAPAAVSETAAAGFASATDAASTSQAAADVTHAGPELAGVDSSAPAFPDAQRDTTPINSAFPRDDAVFATAGIQRITDGELSEQRGGFVYQGVDINFGAEIRSYIGNELVMQTNFNWTDLQANVEHTVSTELTPATLAAVQAGMLNGAGLSMRIGNNNIYVTNEGQTAFVQRADGTLQNIILNSANNVVLRQEIDANLNLSNFAPFQNAAMTGQIVSALSNMASTALTMGSAR